MDHSKMNHAAMMAMSSDAPAGVTEVGQSAFAAIAQIVEVLNADPATDWSKVDIEALRQHLIDMNNVTLRAEVAATATATGARFTVTSPEPEIQAPIRRMVAAQAATMNGTGSWTMVAEEAPGGAMLAVSGTSDDAVNINGLGFIGVMTLGMRPQALLTMLYRSTDCLCRGGVPVQNLSHSASPLAGKNNAPSNSGIKQVLP